MSAQDALDATKTALSAPPGDEPQEISLPDPIPASVFELDSCVPDVTNPEWQSAVATLRDLADLAVGNGWNVVVEGYTDSIGDEDYNKQLSQCRADTVETVMVSDLGYPDDRVDAIGQGIGGNDWSNRKVTVTFRRGGA